MAEEEKFIRNAEAARILGVSPRTLRNWDKSGILKPHHISVSGYRYYTEEQLKGFLNKSESSNQQQNVAPKNISAETNVKKEQNKTSKQPLFKIYVDVGKNEFWLNYYVMRSGKTNSLALATSDYQNNRKYRRTGYCIR